MKRSAVLLATLLAIGGSVAIATPTGAAKGAATMNHDVRPGVGVTSSGWLSDYLPALAGGPGDTRVYYLDSGVPGATVFVAGGTHTNEIAGIATAILLVERAQVKKGRLIVVPYANNSASTYTEGEWKSDPWFAIETPKGTRWFKAGARLTYPGHQGAPDPKIYRHPASSEELPGIEARNLDRAHPGDPNGTLTQKVAYALLSLIKRERVDVAFDLHEAGVGSRLEWMMVANPKNLETAAVAILGLEMKGIAMKLEPSSESFRGLSHREWGDASAAQSYLIETPNPAMVKDPTGVDWVNDPTNPLWKRVGTHLECITEVLAAYNDQAVGGKTITLSELPSLDDIAHRGLGAFYN
jgi:hypothetical protein